jgi:hypothetical protein
MLKVYIGLLETTLTERERQTINLERQIEGTFIFVLFPSIFIAELAETVKEYSKLKSRVVLLDQQEKLLDDDMLNTDIDDSLTLNDSIVSSEISPMDEKRKKAEAAAKKKQEEKKLRGKAIEDRKRLYAMIQGNQIVQLFEKLAQKHEGVDDVELPWSTDHDDNNTLKLPAIQERRSSKSSSS